MKQKYGTQGCYLLKINSRASNRASDEQIPDPWSQYLQKNSIQHQVHLKNWSKPQKLYFCRFFFYFLGMGGSRVLLCITDWPGTCCIDWAGLKFPEIHLISAHRVLRLKVWITRTGFLFSFLFFFDIVYRQAVNLLCSPSCLSWF